MKLLHRRPASADTALRLVSDEHPARAELDAAAAVVDRCVEVIAAADGTVLQTSSALLAAIPHLDAAAELAPADLDVLVAKAAVLHGAAQYASAEEVVDAVLARDPDHFEASTWKEHWAHWETALHFPPWDTEAHELHPAMQQHLYAGHRVQLVRDGLQKALALVLAIDGPAPGPSATVDVVWAHSHTPAGPLVAYYTSIREGSQDPSVAEAFLPLFQPRAFSALEGTFLVRQLGFAPYCFVVLVNADGVVRNRRLVFVRAARRQTQEMARAVAEMEEWLPPERFQEAVRWHMDHFDMERMRFT